MKKLLTYESKNLNAVIKNRRQVAGFTLVELLLVITILGILAGIALPRFFPQAEKGRASEAIGILSAIRQGEEAYLLERGTYLARTRTDGDWSLLGIENPNNNGNSVYFMYSVSVENRAGNNTFEAEARRNAVADPGGNAGTVISIREDGTYCGTHPNVPPNAGVNATTC